MAVHPNTMKNLEPGGSGASKYDIRKAKEAEKWNEIIAVDDVLRELTDMGLRFLKGRRKFTKDQAIVWKSMYEKMADKVLPTAKVKSDVDKTIKIEVKKPDEGGDRPDAS